MSSGHGPCRTIHISFDRVIFGEDDFGSDLERQNIKWRDSLLEDLDKTRVTHCLHLIVNLLGLELIQCSQINPIHIDIVRV
jgi:hypothetical protein